jgi:hypothetical protein
MRWADNTIRKLKAQMSKLKTKYENNKSGISGGHCL